MPANGRWDLIRRLRLTGTQSGERKRRIREKSEESKISVRK